MSSSVSVPDTRGTELAETTKRSGGSSTVSNEKFIDEIVMGSDLTMVYDEYVAPPPIVYNNDLGDVIQGLVPRDYQLYGRDWLRSGVPRKMLTDQAGLGKTLTAMLAAASFPGPRLVVAPKYLVTQWADAIKTQFPDHVVSLCIGSRKDRTAALKRRADWYVVNTAMLRTYVFPFADKLRTVIYDEFHHYRNRKSMQARAAFELTKNPKINIFGLTASPMWKQVDDIWMQLHILQPKIFSSYNDFVDQFCLTDKSSPYGVKVIGLRKKMVKELDEVLSIVCLGRTYGDVGRSLPRTVESTVKVEFPAELRKKYVAIRERFRIEVDEAAERGDNRFITLSAGSMMHTLRQITAFPGKIEAVRDLIEDLDKPAVVFTWYRDHASQVADAIPEAVCITGELDAETRHFLALKAQREKRTIVATLSSLSEGINLYDYRVVVFFECHWPPGSNYQALSRVVRDRNDDGQDQDPVLVYHCMVPNTVDETIYKVTKKREATIRDVMNEILSPI
jgi:superfamily II DNA or RNA helicase